MGTLAKARWVIPTRVGIMRGNRRTEESGRHGGDAEQHHER
jgi:hypothetical protein